MMQLEVVKSLRGTLSLLDLYCGKLDLHLLFSDLSPMCVDSDNDRRTSRSGSPPPEYISAEEDSIYTSSKKGKTLRAPTPYSDSEDTATGQMSTSLL